MYSYSRTVLLFLLYCAFIDNVVIAQNFKSMLEDGLSDWKGRGYQVEGDTIRCSAKGGKLVSKSIYSNFILDFEFKLTPGANNGIGIHYPDKGGTPAQKGIEIQILDNSAAQYAKLKPHQFHGGIYFMAPARKGFLKPVGEWNHQQIQVRGAEVTVILNGEVINEVDLKTLEKKFPKHKGVKRRSGHIVLCGHRSEVSFRKLKVATLP